MGEHEFLMGIRQIALLFVDLLERKLNISPRTSELRKMFKRDRAEEKDRPE